MSQRHTDQRARGPRDMLAAHNGIGASCGHGSLAAILDSGVRVVCLVAFGKALREGRTWVNMPMMEEALRLTKCRFTVVGRKFPTEGLALLQWEGPWTQAGVPPRVACLHRHWVAVRDSEIWDANAEEWLPESEWRELVADMLPQKCTGWTVARGYEVRKGNMP